MAFPMSREYEKGTFKHKMAEAANLPKDLALGLPVVHVTGRSEACVENYRGILEYTDSLVRVQTKCGQIRFTGKHLQIEYYMNDELKITGRITAMEYV